MSKKRRILKDLIENKGLTRDEEKDVLSVTKLVVEETPKVKK